MKSRFLPYILGVLIGLLVGGAAASLFWQQRSRNDRFERAATGLSFHVHLLKTMQDQPPSSSRSLLVNLADSDVLELMALRSRWRSASARELNGKSFREYAQIRKLLPEAENPPEYVLETERAEYVNNSRNIQRYLDTHSAMP